jgi:hypothetical protein
MCRTRWDFGAHHRCQEQRYVAMRSFRARYLDIRATFLERPATSRWSPTPTARTGRTRHPHLLLRLLNLRMIYGTRWMADERAVEPQ